MKIVDLLPRNFGDLEIIDQIDWMMDAYRMAGKLSGDSNKFTHNVEMLELVKNEIKRRNVSFNIFDITGDAITKDKFVELKTNSCF